MSRPEDNSSNSRDVVIDVECLLLLFSLLLLLLGALAAASHSKEEEEEGPTPRNATHLGASGLRIDGIVQETTTLLVY